MHDAPDMGAGWTPIIPVHYRVSAMDDFKPDFKHRSAYPDEEAAEQAVRTRDWARVRAIWDKGTTWRERGQALAGAGVDGSEVFLREVVERHPDDLLAATMLASRLITVGWSIRGDGWGSSVGQTQAEAFHDHLSQAEQLLISVCARDPGFLPAWTHRLTTARALSLGISEARRRYDRAVKIEPHHMGAQQSLLQQLCPKWGGDWDLAHGFANQCAAAAPAGHPNAAIVVDAHMEHWMILKAPEASEYFKDQAVHAQIQDAAQRSVFHPDFDRSRTWIYPFSMFALGFTMIGDWTSAKRCFLELGNYADEWGWQYMDGGAEKAFVTWRAKALEQG